MSGLLESAAAILSASEARLESAAHNVANMSTPGYKRRVAFSSLVGGAEPAAIAPRARHDFAAGSLTSTGNPLDFAISGPGFFQLRGAEGMVYSRQGQFRLAADGSLVTPQGYVLQQEGGGDLIVNRAGFTVSEDATVLDQGVPVARIGIFVPSDTALLQALGEAHFTGPESLFEPVAETMVRQGMSESSNVQVGDEMVTAMAALRQTETGARLVQTYDELLGRALTTFGQRG